MMAKKINEGVPIEIIQKITGLGMDAIEKLKTA